jgi:hypothetical protein
VIGWLRCDVPKVRAIATGMGRVEEPARSDPRRTSGRSRGVAPAPTPCASDARQRAGIGLRHLASQIPGAGAQGHVVVTGAEYEIETGQVQFLDH